MMVRSPRLTFPVFLSKKDVSLSPRSQKDNQMSLPHSSWSLPPPPPEEAAAAEDTSEAAAPMTFSTDSPRPRDLDLDLRPPAEDVDSPPLILLRGGVVPEESLF